MQSILHIKRILQKTAKVHLLVLTTFLVFAPCCLNAQTVTLTVKEAPLKKVFGEIKKQTGYSFIYASEFLERTNPVSFSVNSLPLKAVLELCFKDQPITYSIEEKFIVVKRKEVKTDSFLSQKVSIRGRVINEQKIGIGGASVTALSSGIGTATNDEGGFVLEGIEENTLLQISSIGYHTKEITVSQAGYVEIRLMTAVTPLDQTVVIAYGTTTRRLNTGNVGRITKEDISKQPVGNALAALEGRIAGLLVSQNNGVPGASLNVQIRGQNSIAQGSSPLFLIDGVPFVANNTSASQLVSAASSNANGSGISPFAVIDPATIESIEVLKDADATSIYGSRGANGVILITTKKGKSGEPRFHLNGYSGISTVTRTMDLLNTRQYLAMRREAFANDSIMPTVNNAYDLLLWDTTRYTDFKKMLIGGKAHTNDLQASFAGGSSAAQFILGASYHKETTVFPGSFSDNRGGFYFNISHKSADAKLDISAGGNFYFEKNNILSTDLTGVINLIPNLPDLYDSVGNLKWMDNGVSYNNPLSFLKQSYEARTKNLTGNLKIDYALFKGLHLRSNFGYNFYQNNETATNPVAAQNPSLNPTGTSSFGNRLVEGWSIEPQLSYQRKLGKVKMELLTGATFQYSTNTSSFVAATGFANDNLLRDVNAATGISVSDDYTAYRYNAVFGRLNFNWRDKYIANVSGRRDGSSRFGPGRQFANFGALGIAWIFSNETFIRQHAKFISYGKLRASYGSTGNDQIGDYQYLSAWRTTTWPYQGIGGLQPNNLYNADYSWEVNKKGEVTLDVGFADNAILLSATYFRNRSSNQLIAYRLPYQTGFGSILENFPALIQNTGVEIELSTVNLKKGDFNWSSSFNLTVPRNKLVAFPSLASSSYADRYVIGEPLSIYGGFRFLGVNSLTGVYQFADDKGDATMAPVYPKDWVQNLGNLDPQFYGGLLNKFTYRNLSLDVFFEFKKQQGTNYLYYLSSNIPGTISNQFVKVLERWKGSGDITAIQKFTQDYSSDAGQAAAQFVQNLNDAKYSDASYIRLKNLSLAYRLPLHTIRKMHLQECRLYVQCQNVLTLTKYVGSDPETKNVYALPPLKTVTAGLSITL